jgi:hypothetical protein
MGILGTVSLKRKTNKRGGGFSPSCLFFFLKFTDPLSPLRLVPIISSYDFTDSLRYWITSAHQFPGFLRAHCSVAVAAAHQFPGFLRAHCSTVVAAAHQFPGFLRVRCGIGITIAHQFV